MSAATADHRQQHQREHLKEDGTAVSEKTGNEMKERPSLLFSSFHRLSISATYSMSFAFSSSPSSNQFSDQLLHWRGMGGVSEKLFLEAAPSTLVFLSDFSNSPYTESVHRQKGPLGPNELDFSSPSLVNYF